MIEKMEKADQAALAVASSRARSYSKTEMGISKQIRMIEDYFNNLA